MNTGMEVELGVRIALAAWRQVPAPEGETVKECCKRAFRLVRDSSYTWFLDADDQRFAVALGVLLCHYEGTEVRERLEATLRVLRGLGALRGGVPVDLGALVEELEAVEALPLLDWWRG